MPRRFPQPFWRECTRCWYVQVGKKPIRLSPEKDEAFRLYHELMGRGPEADPSPPAASRAPLVVEVLDHFLDWCERTNARRTYEYYRENIQRFVSRMPMELTVEARKPFHVTKALADFTHLGNNTKNDFIAAVQRALNWATDEELIERNPLGRMKKPARDARELAVSPEECSRVIETVEEPRFRELIEMAWETGGRVQELRHIAARFGTFRPAASCSGRARRRARRCTGSSISPTALVVWTTARQAEWSGLLQEDHERRNMNKCENVAVRLLVAGGDPPILLRLRPEPLREVRSL